MLTFFECVKWIVNISLYHPKNINRDIKKWIYKNKNETLLISSPNENQVKIYFRNLLQSQFTFVLIYTKNISFNIYTKRVSLRQDTLKNVARSNLQVHKTQLFNQQTIAFLDRLNVLKLS